MSLFPSTPSPRRRQHVGRAIQTAYKGYYFRSRLEARWAVFFEKCGINLDWKYEPEGYALLSGWYLPDFLLLNSLWVEIKPASATEEEIYDAGVKLRDVADATGKAAVLLVGDPVDFIGGDETLARGYIADQDDFKTGYEYVSPNAPEGFDGEAWMLIELMTFAHEYGHDVVAAAIAARSARFEHGEKP